MTPLEIREVCDACRTLVLRAAARADGGDAEGLAALFAEDGMLVRPDGIRLQGREAIRAAYAARPAERLTRHVVSNTLVEIVSPTEAQACSYVLLWSGSLADPAGPRGRPAHGLPVLGEFDDRFALTPDGWRILHREARFVLHASH
ncbi:nuclear transport factor 2 family protein [Denitromonas iodatirespirans]|uniref:Nuclear transport factor 2 family protein n=1 Tax=Denitromonas iodatirespirans TaxID=2795389 RepID=A0A944DAT5_DENI1|nr:nuclear transport factor 2 family protein [Denitromonas iodatirespirans]MBT0962930.1 nuclear transport factor 2 family protein [Denitromonas iodatirespirans]